jgi:hypothetical protein
MSMTKSVSVTYHAPPGDSKVVEMFGHTFYDGKAETVEVDDRVLGKLQGNRHFECGEAKDAPQPKKADPAPKVSPKPAPTEKDDFDPDGRPPSDDHPKPFAKKEN